MNLYKEIVSIIRAIPNDRARDVVGERFGIWDADAKTLQLIGNKYGITRERVRQIQETGFKAIKQDGLIKRIDPIVSYLHEYFKENGGLRREEIIASDAKNSGRFKFAKEEGKFIEPALQFCLTIAEPFKRYPESDDFHPVWALNKDVLVSAKKFINSLVGHLEKSGRVVSLDDIVRTVNVSNLSEKAKLSYIDATKYIDQNNFGQWGLARWPEIRLRGVRDKAFIILKKQGKPMHFSEVAKAINESFQAVNTQTVHNELIKDDRFVLVGRGLYGLKDWGFEGGTVKDLMVKIISEQGPQDKDVLLKKVLKSKMVKPNTILVNLQNKSFFKKEADGKYSAVV